MKLIPNELLQKLPPFYSTENEADPICHVKLFNPYGAGTWYIIEFDPDTKVAFGLSVIQEAELGYFSLEELEGLELPWGGGIERDLYFNSVQLSVIRKLYVISPVIS